GRGSARGDHQRRQAGRLRPDRDGLARPPRREGAGARQRDRQGADPLRHPRAGLPALRGLTLQGHGGASSSTSPSVGTTRRHALATAVSSPAGMIRSLYLAGPDVFRPDARERGAELKALCARHGFEGLFPLDQDVPAHVTDPVDQAKWIYHANIGLIERADAVLANLDFFRGPEPDSGTCFEVGYAVARGKPVFGYIPDGGTFAARIRRRHPHAIGPD